MKYGKLIIEKKERELLKELIASDQSPRDRAYMLSLSRLERELQSASELEDATMPSDVIRLNSVVSFEAPGNQKRTFQLVLPKNSNLNQNKISVLAPMGLALLGYATGDAIEWEFPMGVKIIRILEVTQPETELTKP